MTMTLWLLCRIIVLNWMWVIVYVSSRMNFPFRWMWKKTKPASSSDRPNRAGSTFNFFSLIKRVSQSQEAIRFNTFIANCMRYKIQMKKNWTLNAMLIHWKRRRIVMWARKVFANGWPHFFLLVSIDSFTMRQHRFFCGSLASILLLLIWKVFGLHYFLKGFRMILR